MIVLCDIDGTAANIEHRRHFVESKSKSWTRFFEAMVDDTPNEWCQELVRCLHPHEVIFVTGRPENYREQTEKWLDDHYTGLWSELYMRPANNTEPDHKIKQEIYENHINGEVLFVIDDRQQVVDMWRSKGLTVLQCDKGDF